MKSFISFIPVGVFAVVAAGLGWSLTSDPRTMPSTLIDRPVPVFERPSVFEGRDNFTSETLAGRITLVNIFASWCGGCRYEHPFLMKLARERKLPLYGINWKDKPGAGAKWLDTYGNPYLQAGDDAAGRLGIDLGVTGVPETFVIDGTGRIRYRHAGPLTPALWKNVFEPLIAELKARQ